MREEIRERKSERREKNGRAGSSAKERRAREEILEGKKRKGKRKEKSAGWTVL